MPYSWYRNGYRIAVAACVLSFFTGIARAGTELQGLFRDPDAVEFSLVSVTPGNLVYDNFGHTALRVIDHAADLDQSFNWGIFDFSNPIAFSFRFYKGILIYKLGVYPYLYEKAYLKNDGRTAYEDHLNLTRAQKEILLNRLKWHIRPENIDYHYDYFYDNCATRPRDYIDEALGGALRARFSREPTGSTYRDEVRRHYKSLPPIDLALDVLMNSRIDLKMSLWDKAFLPLALREMLLSASRPSEGQGGVTPLVDRSETLLDFPDKATWPLSGHLIYLLIATLLLLGVGRPLLAKRGVSLKFLGALALLYGFFFGAIGCIMPLNWLFSDHLDLHHNANMLFFWPTDLAYILVGLRWLRSGKPIAVFGPRALRLLCHYQDLHVIMLVVGQILWASGVMRQDIGAVSVYVLAPTLLLWILTRRFGFTTNAGGFNGKKGAG